MASKPKQRRSTGGKADAAPVNVQQSINVPFNLLELSPDNVRKIYDPAGILLLRESIARVGLIQGLSVQPVLDDDGNDTGRKSVVGGGRRYRALEQLVNAARLTPDHPIPCVPAQGIAADISLVENSEREALHPLDEFRAFKAMIDAGGAEDSVAKAYRVTVAFVRQRMRMASASPKVLKAFEKDELDLDQLMAFCVTEDHKKQEAVLKAINRGSVNPHAHYIKRALTEDTISANDNRVAFITLDAYQAAGGAVMPDLFGDANHVFLTDTALVTRLIDEKLAKLAEEHLAMGWKWAEASLSISYADKQAMDQLLPIEDDLSPKEQKRVDKMEKELAALQERDELTDAQSKRADELEAALEAIENRPPTFKPEDMARAGVFITMGHHGQVDISYGYIKPEDRLPDEIPADELEEAANGTANGHAPDSGDGSDEDDDAAVKPLSERLVQDLTSFRTIGLRNALANDFSVAFVAVLHALVAARFYRQSSLSCLQISERSEFAANTPSLDTWPATKTHDARNTAWQKRLPEDEDRLWDFLLALDNSDQCALFSHCAAATLNAVDGRGQFGSNRKDQVRNADQLATALGFSMVEAGWTTTAENYFSRVTKAHILAAVEEAKGEQTANLITHMKKESMAVEAERLIQGTGWLPQAMRTPLVDQGADDTDAPAQSVPDFLQSEQAAETVATA